MTSIFHPAQILRTHARVPFALLVALVLVASPYFSFSFVGGGYHDGQRFGEAVCLTLASVIAAWRLLAAPATVAWTSRSALVALVIFFSLGAVSSSVAYSPRLAFHEVATFLLLLILALLVASEVRAASQRYLNAVFCVCGIGCLFYLYHLAINFVAFVLNDVQPRHNDIIHGFDNFRFMNHMQTVSLPILCLLLIRSERYGKQFWLWFGTATMWWSIVFLTSARGTFVGIAGGLLIALILRRRFALRWCALFLATSTAGLVAYVVFFRYLPTAIGFEPLDFLSSTVGRTAADPTSRRLELWSLAWDTILQHPLLGMGPVHFAHYAVHLKNAAHPHNWVLQIASEWGAPALLALLVAVASGCRGLWRASRNLLPKDRLNQDLACAWLTIGGAILIDGLVSGLIVMPVSQLWIAFYIGCALGWVRSRQRSTPLLGNEELRGGIARMLAVLILLAATVLFWNGLYPEVADFARYHEEVTRAFPGMFRPRIWLTGLF
ncbi:MAG TPA: O-antigen ligase family protein [Noviherbaspirillum sp.]|jgi:O-antigen ligase|uniref:O-antigen ligase family protein n=1 Tax=Noviherbaspirillum sp. TaxID=1926288 RepID=UPI002F95A143